MVVDIALFWFKLQAVFRANFNGGKMNRLTVLVAAAATFIAGSQTAANAQSLSVKATCSVSAGVTGGKKYATMKCRKQGQLGGQDIRRVAWEHKDKEEYQFLARIAGRRFTCTMKPDGTDYKADAIYSNYTLSDCNI